MNESQMQVFRHDLRGRWHGLRLCLEALKTCTEPADIIEFLDALAMASDEVIEALKPLEEENEAA